MKYAFTSFMPFITTAFAHVVNYPHVEQCTFDTSNSSFTCNVGPDLICDKHAQFKMHFVNSSCDVQRLWQCGQHLCDKTKKVKTVEVPVTNTVTATETCTETVVETKTLPPVTVVQPITGVIASVTTATVTDTVTTTESVVIVETVCPTNREITIVEPSTSTSPSPTPTHCHHCPKTIGFTTVTVTSPRDVTISQPTETSVVPSNSVVPTEIPCPDDYNTTVTTTEATRDVTVSQPTETSVVPSNSVVPTEIPCPDDYNTTVTTTEATRDVTITETTATTNATETTPIVPPYWYRRF